MTPLPSVGCPALLSAARWCVILGVAELCCSFRRTRNPFPKLPFA